MSTERAPLPIVPTLPVTAAVREIVRLALAEDIGRGDITTEATVAPTAQAQAEILQKQAGVLCGLPVAELVFAALSADFAWNAWSRRDPGASGGRVARITGPARAILSGERTALNFMQRLSGVATAAGAPRNWSMAPMRGCSTPGRPRRASASWRSTRYG